MTQLGESVSVDPSKADPEKSLKAEIIEVEFLNVFKACLNQSTIKPPHWPAAIDPLGNSEHAAVWPFGASGYKIKVKVKVTSKGYSGNGKLSGNLKESFVVEGDLPLSSGEHTIELNSIEAPKNLTWLKGPIFWGLDTPDTCLMIGRTPVEVFFVFSDPASLIFFAKKGVWIEALRFVFTKGKLDGINAMPAGVAEVTQVCFSLPNHRYEVEFGAAKFGGASTTFHLTEYISDNKGAVNCYDQSYAVIVFSGALGVSVDGLFLQPFGFIKEVNLVGWGRCNNPFPRSRPLEKFLVVDPKDPLRRPFGNHMFCEFSVKIYDACAGPVKGGVNRVGYVSNTIDDVMPPGYTVAHMGTAAGMVNIATIGASVLSVE